MPPTRRQMSHGRNLYLRGKSYYWEFKWKGQRHGPKSLGPVSRAVAERQFAEIKLAIIEGRYHEKPTLTFGAFCVEFLRWYKPGHRPTSTERYTGILGRLVDLWGDRPLEQITTLMLERDKRDRSAFRQPRTVNMELRVLKHLFGRAVAWDYLQSNPTKDIEPVLVSEHRRRVLTRTEEQALLAQCGPHLWPLVIFGLQTGLRRSELLALKWPQLDLDRRTVTVLMSKGRKPREVPLTETAILNLPARGGGLDDSVFGYKNFDEVFTDAAKRAGLSRVTPHVLRHTWATRCVEAGVDLPTVQRWLGHASVTQTMVYVHISTTHERASMDRVERQNFQQWSVVSRPLAHE